MAEKFRALSKVMPRSKIDTLKRESFLGDAHHNMDILLRAQSCWSNMSSFRRERDRCKRFTFGDQLSDKVKLPDGRVMTEENYIIEQGSVPLKNNLIGRLVQSVVGVYRSQVKEPVCVARDRDEQEIGETMSITLQYNNQLNKMTEIQSLLLKEDCIGGVPVAKEIYGWKGDKLDCWTDVVPPNDFFTDGSAKDIRGWDITIIGQIHNISFETVCREFASSPDDYNFLSNEYALAKNKTAMMDTMAQFGRSRLSDSDFLLSSDMTLCRVIEVWTKEQKERYHVHDPNNGDIYKIETEDYEEKVVQVNAARRQECLQAGMAEKDIPLLKAEWFIDDFWYFRYLTPTGLVLKEGETPYQHGSHPFIYRVFPGIDGEAHSFVSNVIDQQKYTNKLITTSDFMIKASAKGLLYVPKEALDGTGLTPEDVAAVWASPNGVLCLNGKGGLPQQITAQVSNIGIGDLLNLQMKFFEDISGVNGALQGKPGYSGQSGALYAQQTQNSTTSLLDLLDAFSSFCIDISYKKVKNIQQFYDSKRVVNIAGKAAKQVIYDPNKISDVEFDVSIVESTSTPAYRQVANEFLMQLWQANAINIEQLLSVGQFPFGDELLQAINSQREQIENGQQPAGLPSELINQVKQQTTPENQMLLQNMN